jgi:hypothetical protein
MAIYEAIYQIRFLSFHSLINRAKLLSLRFLIPLARPTSYPHHLIASITYVLSFIFPGLCRGIEGAGSVIGNGALVCMLLEYLHLSMNHVQDIVLPVVSNYNKYPTLCPPHNK